MTALLNEWVPTRPAALPAPDEVHVWRAASEVDWDAARHVLAPSEWRQAARFRVDEDRDRFLATHLTLRLLLADYLDTDPAALDFTCNAHGKPSLAFDWTGMRFNLSHSDGLLLIACGRGREVGVDLELMRDNVPFEMLADAYFEPEDAWQLRLLAPHEKARHFYEVWTRTEACLKADGVGLGGGTQIAEPGRWSVVNFQPAEGYAAALATEGTDFDVTCRTWIP
jgi:4'-phosphopantetheinyl transferase